MGFEMSEQRVRREQSRVWRWRRALGESDLQATTRDILRVLSEFMNSEGDRCYPPIADLAHKSGRDRKTVQDHLRKAEKRGWLRIESAGMKGQHWRRNKYIARWPDDYTDAEMMPKGGGGSLSPRNENLSGEAVELRPIAGGIAPHKVGEQRHTYNNSPVTSPNNSPERGAGERALSPSQRRRSEREFERWKPTWPRHEDYSRDAAKAEWDKLSEADRRECIALTPTYLRWIEGRSKPTSPATYLHEKSWRNLPSINSLTAKIPAKSFSNLWMATWLELLLKASSQPIKLAPIEKHMVDTGQKTIEEMNRNKLADYCSSVVRDMLSAARRREPWRCSTFLDPISEKFQWVKPGSDLLAAWQRLHERRCWPWFSWVPPSGMRFPAVDPATSDLDVAVDAAITEFEAQINKV